MQCRGIHRRAIHPCLSLQIRVQKRHPNASRRFRFFRALCHLGQTFVLRHLVHVVDDALESRQDRRILLSCFPFRFRQARQTCQEAVHRIPQIIAVHLPDAVRLRQECRAGFGRQFDESVDLLDVPFQEVPISDRSALELTQNASGRQTMIQGAVRQIRLLFRPDEPAGSVAGILAIRSGRQQDRHRLCVDALHARGAAQQTRDRGDVPGDILEDALDLAKRDFRYFAQLFPRRLYLNVSFAFRWAP